jgi:hypothetical protein
VSQVLLIARWRSVRHKSTTAALTSGFLEIIRSVQYVLQTGLPPCS